MIVAPPWLKYQKCTDHTATTTLAPEEEFSMKCSQMSVSTDQKFVLVVLHKKDKKHFHVTMWEYYLELRRTT